MATATAKRTELTTLIKKRTNTQLLLMHEMSRETFAQVHGDELGATALVLVEIEAELDRRGFAFCDVCGCANGAHDPAFCA